MTEHNGTRIAALTLHDVISETQRSASHGDGFYSITVTEFEAILSRLKRLGYRTASSREFIAWQQGKQDLPKRTVVLTFDDGYKNHLERVAPLLVRYRFGGTFFVTLDLIGRPGYVTWEDLKKMVFLGMEIGSHGVSHRPLSQLSRDEMEREIVESKKVLEEKLGVPITAIAAPGGFWNRPIAEAVEKAGYEAAWVSTIGTNGPQTHPLALRRIVVRRPFSIERVVSMVEGWQPAFWWAVGQQQLIWLLKKMLGVYWYEQLKRRIVPNA
ncbi:MAG: polysaccharide deacetylase family protein [Candidatus Omnitrophica bacterium]|nr:polysaccharide deacetylase family protein [Candidatus Omnitrophota bacterium]